MASELHLTFDDGPEPSSTPQVLDLLDRTNVKATFFLITKKAEKNPQLTERILKSGHTIGNHSLDHTYGVFFKRREAMLSWISESEKRLSHCIGKPSIGFRPPNGICTPHLHWALNELKMPLILWDIRFFDAVWGLSVRRVKKSFKKARDGSIVLLHDKQPSSRLPEFLLALETYITEARRLDFKLTPIKSMGARQEGQE